MNKIAPARITEGVIWKQLLSFFFPIFLGTLFQQLYNTADTVIVGRAVGTQALAAVGSTSAFVNLINGFFIGLSTGATVLLSQFYGAEDRQGVEDALHTGMALSVILGLLTVLLGVCSAPWMMVLTKIPEDCRADALTYTRIYFSGALASMIYNMGAGILRAMGDSKRPMVFLIIACFSNIVLDLVLVVVLQMGVAGAALATVLSQCLSAVLVVVTLWKSQGLRLRKLSLKGNLLARILRVGLPAGLQFITFDISNVLIQSGINSFGATTIAGWTAYVKTDSIVWMISGAFGVSVTTFVGQNFGAQKYGRIRRSVSTCMIMSVGTQLVLSALLILLRYPILSVYTTDPEVIRAGAYVMLWIVPFNAIFMPVEVFAGAMRGTGYSAMPTVITCTSVCLFRVLWVAIPVALWHSVEMLALAYPLSWILSATVFYIAYRRGTWLHKRIRECGMAAEVR
jgi:putative MATE family efflux protein